MPCELDINLEVLNEELSNNFNATTYFPDDLLKIAVKPTATGNPLVVKDSADYRLLDAQFEGGTRQDGVPSPTEPTPIVNGQLSVIGNTGKNIFDYPAWIKGVTFTNNGKGVFENNGITFSSTSSADAYTNWGVDSYPIDARIPVKEGQTIVMSWECIDKNVGHFYIFPNGKVNGITGTTNNSKKIVYTATKGVTFVTFRVGVDNPNTTLEVKNIMFEYGQKPTPYEPYIGQTIELPVPIELAEGDRVYKINGEWKVERNIFFGLINENSNIALTGTNTDGINRAYVTFTEIMPHEDKNTKAPSLYCDKFVTSRSIDTYRKIESLGIETQKVIFYYEEIGRYNVQQVKDWLKANPIKFQCLRKTPIITDIPAEDIPMLEALSTYYHTTTFTTNDLITMNVKYLADTKEYIDQKCSQLNNAVLSLGGNI